MAAAKKLIRQGGKDPFRHLDIAAKTIAKSFFGGGAGIHLDISTLQQKTIDKSTFGRGAGIHLDTSTLQQKRSLKAHLAGGQGSI